MERQKRHDEEYQRAAREREVLFISLYHQEEFVKDIEQKMNKAKTVFNNIFGNTIKHYKEINKNIDENVEKLREYLKKK